MYKCIKSTVWYTLTFEAGEVYDIDDMLASRLLRAGVIEPHKEMVKAIPEEVEPEVDQPETHSVFEPVVTSIEPLHNDSIMPERVKSISKPAKNKHKNK